MLEIFTYNSLLKSAFLNLKVKASAKANAVNDLITVNDKLYLKLSIKASPEKGKANEEIINYLAKEWRIERNNLEIIKGQTSNLKTLLIKNIEQDYLNLILKPYI
ncbi:A1G_07140 family DUF167 domain protein [Rickettsia endosymbiont of Halotydeus destructor]|uniref:A1G_07140 family DUF167 domain protein n=1 Tax=Rickettsia endosymbiont of Halotydeus destructor TaxID=2996754 RepID=UPI003BAE6FAC